MSIRVAFCGASGTGKSTLAQYVADTYRVPQNPIGSRSVSASMGFASPYDVDAAGRRAEFQRRLLIEKVQWEAEQDAFVTDRTPLDNLLYTMLHDVHCIDEETLALVRSGLARYTHVIYCPVVAFCRIGGDPARVQSLQYQELYDAALCGLLQRYIVPPRVYTPLLLDQADERKLMVRWWIDYGGTW